MMMQVPFFIDPAWSTLQADFDERGALCTTISGVYIEGKNTVEAYYHMMKWMKIGGSCIPLPFNFEIITGTSLQSPK